MASPSLISMRTAEPSMTPSREERRPPVSPPVTCTIQEEVVHSRRVCVTDDVVFQMMGHVWVGGLTPRQATYGRAIVKLVYYCSRLSQGRCNSSEVEYQLLSPYR